jgi:hypothetical protein
MQQRLIQFVGEEKGKEMDLKWDVASAADVPLNSTPTNTKEANSRYSLLILHM